MNSGHERFRDQLPALALGALDPAERSGLEHHLQACAECRAELAWLERGTEVLTGDVEPVEPPPGLRSRVMGAIEEASDRQALGGESAGSAPTEPAGRPERPSGKGTGWLAGLLRPAALVAAVAALMLGIAVGVTLDRGDSPSVPERQVLSGQSTIGADAVLVASGGTGTLKMTGLKRPDRGRIYQAWIQRGQSVIPTDSLFVPDRNGSATVSVPDIGGVSAVMVSLEPGGGSIQPTTAPVITVSIPGQA